jgi:hypothetical protein
VGTGKEASFEVIIKGLEGRVVVVVLTALLLVVVVVLLLQGTIFWDITPCSPLNVNRLDGVISQKIVPFITTAVKSSNPTQ